MYNSFKNIFSNVIINSNYSDKMPYTHHIFLGHYNNYYYIEQMGIQYTYFTPYASNCMFVKPINLVKEFIDNYFKKLDK